MLIVTELNLFHLFIKFLIIECLLGLVNIYLNINIYLFFIYIFISWYVCWDKYQKFEIFLKFYWVGHTNFMPDLHKIALQNLVTSG